MRSVWQCYDGLVTDGDTGSTSSARVFGLFMSSEFLKHLLTLRATVLGASAQMHCVVIPASNSQSHLHSHHSLYRVTEMVATAASLSATVS